MVSSGKVEQEIRMQVAACLGFGYHRVYDLRHGAEDVCDRRRDCRFSVHRRRLRRCGVCDMDDARVGLPWSDCFFHDGLAKNKSAVEVTALSCDFSLMYF